MRSDIKEAIQRSLEIKKEEQAVPKKLRKKIVKPLIAEKKWDEIDTHLEDPEEMSMVEKIQIARLLLGHILKYGYAWLPETVKESGKRIATTAPILMTLNMLVRFSLIPILYVSNLPESPALSFGLYTLVNLIVHENEVRILKKAPVVVNQYVSTLSFLFPPRLASLVFRVPNYLPTAALLLGPAETNKAVTSYIYYALLWFAVVEGIGATAVYSLLDRNKPPAVVTWDSN